MRTWTKALVAAAMTISAPAAAQSPLGDWAGTLNVNGMTLRIVVHVAAGPDGAITGTLDSLDQGATGIPIAEIGSEDGVLSFTVPLVAGSYRGTWDEAARQWTGEWSQGGVALPLDLSASGPPEPTAPLPADWRPPDDARIGELIADRIGARAGQGIVVGVIEPEGVRTIAGGPEDAAPLDGGTLFEIGSISKVFTALILADMAGKGEVSLEDPAARYLPAGHRLPERGGRSITLRDLATHVSGLPRLPDNMPFGDPDDPYADYTEAHMLAFLDGYELPRDVGAQHEYSNLGSGLLGYLLGRAAGTDYETLLRQRITGPLGMDDTMVVLPESHAGRLAPAFDIYMRPAKPWHLPTLVGAGGIRSTAADMLKFAAAALDESSSIGAAMKATLAVREETGDDRVVQALGWQVFRPEPGREIVTHGGGTGGFRSQLVLEPATARAVIALTNAAAEPSVGDIASHVLAGTPVAPTASVPPAPPPVEARTEVALSTAELDRVVGRYDFGDGINEILRDGNQLRSVRVGVPTLPIYPEAPLRFFFKAIDAQVRFTTDEAGTVTGVIFTMPGIERIGKRLEP